uniref:TLC domain-containing protein n=1 Tax=Anolis carolinensis TaxID=28377 RepID=A0A803SXP2_ANOCA
MLYPGWFIKCSAMADSGCSAFHVPCSCLGSAAAFGGPCVDLFTAAWYTVDSCRDERIPLVLRCTFPRSNRQPLHRGRGGASSSLPAPSPVAPPPPEREGGAKGGMDPSDWLRRGALSSSSSSSRAPPSTGGPSGGPKQQQQQQQRRWRCVSTLHALIVGLFCLYILWFDDAVNANPIWGDPWLVKLNVAITCGYLLYDLLLLMRYWRTLGDSLFVCHHLAALYAYGYVLSRGVLPFFANFRLISELSTPFVNLRWFLDTAGWPRSSWLVLANGLAMMVVFFVVRIAVIPSYYAQVYFWYGTPEYERLGLWVQLAWIVPSVALEVLNVVWMYRIIRGFYRAFCRSKARKAT